MHYYGVLNSAPTMLPTRLPEDNPHILRYGTRVVGYDGFYFPIFVESCIHPIHDIW